MDILSYKDFLQEKCAHCFKTLKSDKNRMIKMLAEYPKCEEDCDLSSEPEITNFDAISTLYGHSKKSLADKFVEQFKSSLTNDEFVLSLEVSKERNDMCPLMVTSENLGFCNDCGLLFTQVYRINKTFRNLSNKNSLLCKTIPELFSIIDDNQLSALDEWEMKIENETPEIEDPSEDPLMVDNNLNECEEDAFFDNNVEEYNSGNESADLQNHSDAFFGVKSCQDNSIVIADSQLSVIAGVTERKQRKQDLTAFKEVSVVLNMGQLPSIYKNKRVKISTPIADSELSDNFQDRTRGRYSLRNKKKSKFDDSSDDGSSVQEDEKSFSDFVKSESELTGKEHVSVKKSKQIKPDKRHKSSEIIITQTKKKQKDEKPYITVPNKKISNSQKYNYICRECGNRFYSISKMRFHLLSHAKESDAVTVCHETIKGPPYHCPKCNKKFRNYNSLKLHVVRVHNIRLLTISEMKGKRADQKSCHNCSQCGLAYDGIRGLGMHYSKMHKMSLYICVECDVGFLTKAELDFHSQDEDHHQIKTCRREKSFTHYEPVLDVSQAEDVEEDSESKGDEAKGKEEENGTKIRHKTEDVFKGPPCKCLKCCESYQYLVDLKSHCATDNLNLPGLKVDRKPTNFLKCDDCEILQFKHFEQFEAHHRVKHGVKYIQCQWCPKVFTDKDEFETHHEKMHPVAVGANSLESNTVEKSQDKQPNVGDDNEICEEPFFCRQCNFSFKNIIAITAHNRINHSIKIFDCKNCSESFKNGMALLHHLSNTHNIFAHINNYKDTYTCADCEDNVYDSFSSLQKHFQETRHSSFIITCAFCGKQFQSKSDLSSHKISNHGKILRSAIWEKKIIFECPFCDLTFPSMTERNKHRLTHPKEEQLFKCKECPKVYTTTNSLHAHREVMHMEKFQCDECGKSIAGIRKYRSHCKMHIEKASGVKPLCDLCGKTYSSKKQLQKHKALNHLRQQEKHCQICGYISRESYYFKKHMQLHERNGTPKPKKKKWFMV